MVARLADSKLGLALAEAAGRKYQVRRVRYEQLQSLRVWDEQSVAQGPTAAAALADAETQLAERRRQAGMLVLTAPIDGVVVAPPTVDGETEQGQLPIWSGSPLDARNAGCWIEPGTVLCTVANPERLVALVAVDQADVPEVAVEQTVRILVASSPVRVLEGQVVEVAQRGARRAMTQTAVDAGKYHLVEVELTTDDPLLLIGARGTAKIAASRTTLRAIASYQLRRLLRLPW